MSPEPSAEGGGREAARQQALLAALRGELPVAALRPWLHAASAVERGLQAYRAAAGALAERALAAAFPTVQQLIGAAAFGAVARALWHRHPPVDGDIARWGGGLPAFIEGSADLAAEPYLADVARLDWAVHGAASAADAGSAAGLQHLAECDPGHLLLRLAPGSALIVSPYPVATIWQAHRSSQPHRFDAVREALAAGQREHVRISRPGWVPQVQAIGADEARFIAELLQGRSLARALDAAGGGFAFDRWLVEALRTRQLAEVVRQSDGG